MGLNYRIRPVLTELQGLNNYELWSLAREEHRNGDMLHIQEDTYLRQGSAELDVARDALAGITFAGA